MKNLIYIVFVFLMASACKPGVPNDIIQPDEMALVMHDVHLADAHIQNIYIPDSAVKVASAYYGGIYKKFGIDSALYKKSLDYYMLNPRVMDGIYEKVTAALTKEKAVLVRADSIAYEKERKARLKRMKADSTKRADSLKKVQLVKSKDSLNKALKVKKADSLKKAKAATKTKLKKRADSLKRLRSVKTKN